MHITVYGKRFTAIQMVIRHPKSRNASICLLFAQYKHNANNYGKSIWEFLISSIPYVLMALINIVTVDNVAFVIKFNPC